MTHAGRTESAVMVSGQDANAAHVTMPTPQWHGTLAYITVHDCDVWKKKTRSMLSVQNC